MYLLSSEPKTNSQPERTFSYRVKLRNVSDLDSTKSLSRPGSPKVKAVVEKSDSVSYVLEMEESPETIANKILRRSFRNATPPKGSPNGNGKCSAVKRPRMKGGNPLSLSASAGAIPCSGKQSELRWDAMPLL